MAPHRITYVELGSTDLPASTDFYGRAFGWSCNDYGPTYAGIQNPDGDGEIGGISSDAPVGSSGPLVLIESEDLDASLASVIAAGGTIVVEPFEYPGGRRFQFTDPSGNQLGVFQPAH